MQVAGPVKEETLWNEFVIGALASVGGSVTITEALEGAMTLMGRI